MRKSRTVHLEEDFWREMDEYKELNTCGSRNTALERMLLERRMLIGLVQQLGLAGGIGNTTTVGFGIPVGMTQHQPQPVETPQEVPVTPSKPKPNKATKSMLSSSRRGMPDE